MRSNEAMQMTPTTLLKKLILRVREGDRQALSNYLSTIYESTTETLGRLEGSLVHLKNMEDIHSTNLSAVMMYEIQFAQVLLLVARNELLIARNQLGPVVSSWKEETQNM